MRSANAATVRLGEAVGERRVAALARRAGIRSPLDAVPALALGAGEVTPLELVAAYAPFANGGLRVTPSLVRRIEAGDGTVLWRAPAPVAERVLGAAEAFQLTSMLKSVVDGGTGRVLRDRGVREPVAGKTGTTNDGTDVWFVGYTPTVVAAVWFGYDAPRPIAPAASGGRLAAPAWAAFYLDGWRERTPVGLDAARGHGEPDDRRVQRRSRQRVVPGDPARVVPPGTEPTRTCREHSAPFIDRLEEFGRKVGKAVKDLLGL